MDEINNESNLTLMEHIIKQIKDLIMKMMEHETFISFTHIYS